MVPLPVDPEEEVKLGVKVFQNLFLTPIKESKTEKD